MQKSRLKLVDKSFKVNLKDAEDSRSELAEADTATQKDIIEALREEWGEQLNIIDEKYDDLLSSMSDMTFDTLRIDIFDYGIPNETTEMKF